MPKAEWSAVQALVNEMFEQGMTPDRTDLVDFAFSRDASDDVIDALDTLGPRKLDSLAALKEALEKNSALA